MNSDWIATFEALRSVYIDQAYSNIAINEALLKHKDAKAGFVRTFTKGVLRDSIKLDYYIDRLASKGIKGIKSRTIVIIRMGIFAIESLDSVPDYSACDEAVKLAKKVSKGSDRFVNAMLRNFVRRRDELLVKCVTEADIIDGSLSKSQLSDIAIAKSFDRKFVELVYHQYGAEECLSILDGLNKPPALVIRTNTLKITRDELVDKLTDEGFDVEPVDTSRVAIIVNGGSVTNSQLFRDGYFSIQSLSSILSIEAFMPEPGKKVLDMCAAPGGKTAAMAELMENKGTILSCDIYEHRCELIDSTVKRLGIDIVETRMMDATQNDESLNESFDYVLCDAPCSGLGVISTKPEIKLKNRTDAGELTEIQLKALTNAFSYVKDGGYVMYSTCTINKDENEGIVKKFMVENSQSASIIENNTFLSYNNMIGFYHCIIKKTEKK